MSDLYKIRICSATFTEYFYYLFLLNSILSKYNTI